MKKTFRIISFVLAFVCAVACFDFLPARRAAAAPVYPASMSAMGTPVTTEIKVNGTGTGTYLTQISNTSSGILHSGKDVNIVEADLSNVNVTVELADTRECGVKYTTKSIENFVPLYNAANPGTTVLSAVNGNWFTIVQNGTGAFYLNAGLRGGKTYPVTYGVDIENGEIRCSQLTGKEALCTTSASEVVDGPYTFGITDRNQPVIGELKVVTEITNKTRGTSVKADGINRAPVPNTLMVYNKHLNNDSNYTNTDAYEVVITADNTSFRIGKTVKGTVTAIHPAGSAERTDISDNVIILTARGTDQIAEISGYQLGDSVEVCASVYDRLGGDASLWNTVRFTVGGTNLILKDGLETGFAMNEDNYPANIIGYKDDGTFVMCTVTKHEDGRAGIWGSEYVNFCKAVGYNTCFMLDGGGSTTMVTLDGEGYVRRTSYASEDGHGGYTARNVAESLMVVYKDAPVCAEQGNLDHIKKHDISNCSSSANYLEIPASQMTWKLGNSDGRILSYDSYGNPSVAADSAALAWPVAYLPAAVSSSSYPYCELFYYVNTTSAIVPFVSVGGDRMHDDFIATAGPELQHVSLNMSGTVSRPTFALSGEVVFVKMVFFKTAAAQTEYISSTVDFLDDFNGGGSFISEIENGNTPSININDGSALSDSNHILMRRLWTPSRINNGISNRNNAIVERQYEGSENLVMKVSGSQWFYTDSGYKYKTAFSADIRRGATDGFSGFILNYGADYTGSWTGSASQNDYYYTEFSSVRSNSSEASFAMATGFGFTFRKDSDRYLRIFVRTLEGTEFNVIYYDFDAGEGVSLNEYHNYAFYNDTNSQTAALYFDGKCAAVIEYGSGVQLSGQPTSFGRTLDEYYYRTAVIKDGNGTVKAETDKALISNTGKAVISSSGAGNVTYYDNISVKSYNSLPSGISVMASIGVGADLSASVAVSLPETFRSRDVSVDFVMNGEHTEKATAPGGGYYVSEYFTGIDMNGMTDTVIAEVKYMGTVIASETFTAEECLIETARLYPQYETFIADLIDFGAALQDYSGYNTSDKADKGTLTGTAVYTKPEGAVKEVLIAGTESDKLTAATLYINNKVSLLFRFNATNATKISVTTSDGTVVTAISELSGSYIVTDAVPATDFGKIYTVTLLDAGDHELSKIRYNVNAYLVSKWDSAAVGNICKIMSGIASAAAAF